MAIANIQHCGAQHYTPHFKTIIRYNVHCVNKIIDYNT